ncbi:zinc-binding alcohol dehydrogenase family protein [Actinoplanes sp. NPDC051470]|uniref:zinc-binding alcohol dehydrogenase family protein n=1 Tax=unclassified Actinoplanes TaxID=2626549 RepID=UPI003447DC4A
MRVDAAVVHSFSEAPRYEAFDIPDPAGDDQVAAEVLVAGLHPRVRSAAAGNHYTSTGVLPMIPGIDGVARLADGHIVYFVADDHLPGSLASHTVLDPRRTVPIPPDVDLAKIAAGLNPAMSSWVALRRRVPLEPGQSVLVLGATGNAGQLAIQVAKRLGAARVVAAGRNSARLATLPALGADTTVPLDGSPYALAEAAAEVDIVLDYLWGQPATDAIMAVLRARPDRSRAMNWIQIGSVAGPTITLPSVALRSANFRLQGNGQGAVSTRAYLEELPALIQEINTGAIEVTAAESRLADIEKLWSTPEKPGTRTVLVP